MKIRSLCGWVAVGLLAGSLSTLSRAQDAVEPGGPFPDDVINKLGEYGVKVDGNAARRAAIEAVVRTADPQARLLSPDEVEALLERREGRVPVTGLRFSSTNGLVYVRGIYPGTPAAEAGIKEGSVLAKIDGDASAALNGIEAETRVNRSEGDSVLVTLVTPAGETNDVTLARRPVQLETVELGEEFPGGLAYLRLNGLYPGCAAQIESILRGWSEGGRFGLVVDLRGAAGGDVDAAARIAGLYGQENSVLFTFRDHQDQDIGVHKAEAARPLNMPTMVIVNEQTSGASEILAAALKKSIRGAMIIGMPTSGDPMIRDVVQITPDHRIYVAVRKLVTPDGTSYGGSESLQPDVRAVARPTQDYDFEPAEEENRPGRKLLPEELEDRLIRERVKGDATLRRAVDILLGLKALNIRGFHSTDADTH